MIYGIGDQDYSLRVICLGVFIVRVSLIALYTVNKKRSGAVSLAERFGLLRMFAYVVSAKF
ncbi:hypothetical protein L4D00_07915 [Photobacterium swingsii]|uniref:hypothetical protein n=1 Tax=Photobacterium swingsii TaxID=680026 RepID=UPI003D0CB6FC